MSIEDDVALLERVPTLRLLGTTALRMVAALEEIKKMPPDHKPNTGENRGGNHSQGGGH